VSAIGAAGPGPGKGRGRMPEALRQELERAGFDLALAQAMLNRPFLAPCSPAPSGGSKAASSGANRTSADGSNGQSAAGMTSETRAESADEGGGETAMTYAGNGVRAAARQSESDSAACEPGGRRRAGDSPPPAGQSPALDNTRVGNASARGVAGAQGVFEEAGVVLSSPAASAQEAGVEDLPEGEAPASRNSETRFEPGPRAPLPVEVTVPFADGEKGHVRVTLRGQSVRAVIVAPDALAAKQMEGQVRDLHAALARQGFLKTRVLIRPADDEPSPGDDGGSEEQARAGRIGPPAGKATATSNRTHEDPVTPTAARHYKR
jgi:hypothetical protein